MSPVTKMLLDLEYKNWKKGRKEGIIETIKKMLEYEETEEKIMKYTGISKEELNRIKGELTS